MNGRFTDFKAFPNGLWVCGGGFGTKILKVSGPQHAADLRLIVNNLVLVPYNQNPDYVGRSTILDTVKERLGYSKSLAARQSRVSLFGLGGVG
jgi:hypothetical protein